MEVTFKQIAVLAVIAVFIVIAVIVVGKVFMKFVKKYTNNSKF